MASVFDIFEQDAFSAHTLSARIQDHKQSADYVPQFLGSLGIFEAYPIRTTHFDIENREGTLRLIPVTERAEPLPQYEKQKRSIRTFKTVRLAKGGVITAHEIQNIRQFGSMELQEMMIELDRMVYGAGGLMQDMEATWEHHRLGALQGKVLDSDGVTEIIDWYDEWGITEPDEINFALDTATTDVRGKCHEVVRAMGRAAKGAWTAGTTVAALASDTFYDKLINHKQVRETYTNWEAASALREGSAWTAFRYGNIDFFNYRGTDDNSTIAIADGKAKFFPRNAPGVFRVALSPLESFEFANRQGQEVYEMVVRDLERDQWVKPEVYSYPLFVCTRPEMLQRGTAT